MPTFKNEIFVKLKAVRQRKPRSKYIKASVINITINTNIHQHVNKVDNTYTEINLIKLLNKNKNDKPIFNITSNSIIMPNIIMPKTRKRVRDSENSDITFIEIESVDTKRLRKPGSKFESTTINIITNTTIQQYVHR